MKTCLTWAVRQGYIEKNPIALLQVPSAEHREVTVPPGEFQQLISAIPDGSFRDLVIITWETGCRPQESLRVEARQKGPCTKEYQVRCPAKAAATKTPKTDGKLSQLDAGVKVLADSGIPMTTKTMIEAMASKGYWTSPGGATPHATLYSAILRELQKMGTEARFGKADRGQFKLNATVK